MICPSFFMRRSPPGGVVETSAIRTERPSLTLAFLCVSPACRREVPVLAPPTLLNIILGIALVIYRFFRDTRTPFPTGFSFFDRAVCL